METMARITIIEDQLESVRIIESHLKGSEHLLVGHFGSVEEARERLRDTHHQGSDVYILDIGLPGAQGYTLIPDILKANPKAEIVMHTVFEDVTAILRCIEAGATGYVLKGVGREEFLLAVRTVLEGGSHLTGRVAKRVLTNLRGKERSSEPNQYRLPDSLSPREGEILLGLAKGMSCKEIAAFLGISFHTVGNH